MIKGKTMINDIEFLGTTRCTNTAEFLNLLPPSGKVGYIVRVPEGTYKARESEIQQRLTALSYPPIKKAVQVTKINIAGDWYDTFVLIFEYKEGEKTNGN